MRLTLIRKSAWHPSLAGGAAGGCGCTLLQQKRQAVAGVVCAGACAWTGLGERGQVREDSWDLFSREKYARSLAGAGEWHWRAHGSECLLCITDL